MSVQVFISYSRKDRSLTEAIVAFLEKQFVVWWDDDLVGGTDFANDIFRKIEKTQVAIVVWSANAAVSAWVQNESQAAVGRCPCIPILLDDTPLPRHLAHLNAIDLRSWDGTREPRELRKLAQDITLHLASAQKPTIESIVQAQLPEASSVKPAVAKRVLFPLLMFLAFLLFLVFLFIGANTPSVGTPHTKCPPWDTFTRPASDAEGTPTSTSVTPPPTNQTSPVSGCEGDTWSTLVQNTADQSSIQTPRFLVEFPAGSAWGENVKTHLLHKEYDEARKLLAQYEFRDPAAMNLLAVLDTFKFGQDAMPHSAPRNFLKAAEQGNKIALANLGISHILGLGVPIDPSKGIGLVEQSIKDGLAPEKALEMLSQGSSLLKISNYAELIKTIHLEAAKGRPLAAAIEGEMATMGLAKDPCAPQCAQIAKNQADKLRAMGKPALANVVENDMRARDNIRGALSTSYAKQIPRESKLRSPFASSEIFGSVNELSGLLEPKPRSTSEMSKTFGSANKSSRPPLR